MTVEPKQLSLDEIKKILIDRAVMLYVFHQLKNKTDLSYDEIFNFNYFAKLKEYPVNFLEGLMNIVSEIIINTTPQGQSMLEGSTYLIIINILHGLLEIENYLQEEPLDNSKDRIKLFNDLGFADPFWVDIANKAMLFWFTSSIDELINRGKTPNEAKEILGVQNFPLPEFKVNRVYTFH